MNDSPAAKVAIVGALTASAEVVVGARMLPLCSEGATSSRERLVIERHGTGSGASTHAIANVAGSQYALVRASAGIAGADDKTGEGVDKTDGSAATTAACEPDVLARANDLPKAPAPALAAAQALAVAAADIAVAANLSVSAAARAAAVGRPSRRGRGPATGEARARSHADREERIGNGGREGQGEVE